MYSSDRGSLAPPQNVKYSTLLMGLAIVLVLGLGICRLKNWHPLNTVSGHSSCFVALSVIFYLGLKVHFRSDL